jgi:hypothetical protein
MRSPALALGWELWARHRWGLSAVGAGLLVAAGLAQAVPAGRPALVVGEVAQSLVLFVYLYLLSVFVYAEGTFGGKAAGFPPRLFTLPLPTRLLVGWPMLYGTAAAALLWLALAGLILIPCGRLATVDAWPALLLAAYMACTQAVCWTLARTPLFRLVTVILLLPCVVMSLVFLWVRYNLHVTITQLNLGLCAVIGLAYAAAVAGVARDRRGDRLAWDRLGRLLLRAVPRWPARERPFPSPAAAQRWLEVRRHAWLLPTFAGSFVVLLFWAVVFPLSPEQVAQFAAAIVAVPTGLAFLVGFGMGKTSFWARDLRLSSFLATRPLSAAELAGAKLYAAGWSALATWALVLLLAPLWAVLSGNVPAVRALGEGLLHGQPAWKLGLLVPVILAGLVGLTWLQLVAGMCLSLTGRAWVVNGVALLYVAVGAALARLFVWAGSHAEFAGTLPTVLWWLGGGLALLKLSAAAWAWGRLGWRHDRVAARLLVWLVIAGCLLVPLYALVPAGPFPRGLVALFVVLALPLTRLTALPAAVAWNRHR